MTATTLRTTTAREPKGLVLVFLMAQRGFRLFTIEKRGKRPLIEKWPEKATCNAEGLRAWMREYPGCNWGLVCGPASGVFVLDVDGAEGEAAIREFNESHGHDWAETLSVKTARGMHLYFKYPQREIRNSVSKLAWGLDVRGEGGYVLVPPSVHPSGAIYRWAGAGKDAPIMSAPTWLLEMQTALAHPMSATPAVGGDIIPEGRRNTTLTKLAGAMRRHDSTPQAIEAALLVENAVRCEPPLPDTEVHGIARSVSRYAPAGSAPAAIAMFAPSEPARGNDISMAAISPEELVRNIEGFFHRFLVLPMGFTFVLALYSLATYCFEAFEQFPYLIVISPVKGCGKTRLTEVFEQVAANVVRTVGISVAALFRIIQKMKPTLIIDEAESLAGKSERAQELGAILNSGNRKNTVVPRCVGKNHELGMFSIYCPKVVCAIQKVSEPTKDRAIVIVMQKKLGSQHIDRFIGRNVTPQGAALRERIGTLISAKKKEIEAAYEKLELDFLPDRDAENWLPLFSVLQVLAADRIPELRALAIQMTGAKAAADQDDSLGLRLLGDLQAVWRGDETTALTTDLISRLEGIDDAPWHDAFKLDARRLARLLRGFDVFPRQVRTGGVTGKGYRQEELSIAVSRYVVGPKHGKQPATGVDVTQLWERKQASSVSDEKSEESPLSIGVVSHVSPVGAEVQPRIRGEM